MKIFKNNQGFSLVEMMVTVGIMAVISAIAIPNYLKYRKLAAYGALNGSLLNAAKAYNTCVSLKGHEACKSLSAIGIKNWAGGSSTSGSNFCADIDTSINGESVKACVEFKNPIVKTSNQRFCFKDITTGTYDKNGTDTNYAAGHDDEALHYELGPCTADDDCTGTVDKCQTAGGTGVCSTGTCS